MEYDNRFDDGSVLYFNPFIFGENNAKPKYFIVLKHTSDTVIIASLPTSKDSVPENIDKQHGCIESTGIDFNCYFFSPDIDICTNGFSFPKETYIYGFRLQEWDFRTFLFQEINEQTTIQQVGILKENEYLKIIQCLKQSHSVKRKFKKVL